MVSEQFNPIIFDLGSSTVRAGWAGHDQPKFVESSYMGRKVDGSLDPIPLRFLNNVKRPTDPVAEVVRAQQYSASSEWILELDCLSSLSDTLLYSARGLQTNALERPVFATCPTGASPAFKRAYYEHFMETAQAPAFFLGDTSVLAIYAAGRVSGICVDVGASSSTVARVDKGASAEAWTYSVGGDTVDQFIASRIDIEVASGGNSESYQEQQKLAIVREIKHSACKCSHHALPPTPAARAGRSGRKQAVTSPRSGEPVPFKLPDGSEVDVSAVQEYAAETLFVPSQQDGFPGLTAAIQGAMQEEASDEFILLTGGSAHFHGLHSRLVHELGTQNVFPFAQWTHRVHSGFLGASILASLSSFASLWVTPASYLEAGIDRLVSAK